MEPLDHTGETTQECEVVVIGGSQLLRDRLGSSRLLPQLTQLTVRSPAPSLGHD